MHNDAIKSKLASYSVLASSLIVGGTVANAQIVYTDIIPDFALDLGPFALDSIYPMDLDNNGQVDFEFSAHIKLWATTSAFGKMYWLWGKNDLQNEFAGSSQFSIYALNEGDKIFNNINWKVNSGGMLGVYSWSSQPPWGIDTLQNGSWVTKQNGFVGVRLINNGDSLYGWIRMDVDIHDHLIIKDYAYNTLPNQPILAGEGIPTSINPVSENEYKISPNPVSTTFQLNYDNTASSLLFITDAFGTVIKQMILDPSLSGITISTDDLADGVYFVILKEGNNRVLKKLVVAR